MMFLWHKSSKMRRLGKHAAVAVPLMGTAATIAGAALMAGGCGSGGGTAPITPPIGASASTTPFVPTLPTVPPSPTPTTPPIPTPTPTIPAGGFRAIPPRPILPPPPFTIPGSSPGSPSGPPPTRAVKLPTRAAKTRQTATAPYFFDDSVNLGSGVYYADAFGYYNLDFYSQGQPYIYKYGFGYLYYYGDDGGDGDYFYDFTSGDTFYTAASLYPYIYSFNRSTFLYYFEDEDSENDARAFYDYRLGDYITY